MITTIFTIIAFGMYTLFLCYRWVVAMFLFQEEIDHELIGLTIFWWVSLWFLNYVVWS